MGGIHMNTEQLKATLEKKYRVTQSESKEHTMNTNTDKVVETVKENVNKIVNAGKDAALNPRLIGEKLAETMNNMGDKKQTVKDAVKLGFTMIKQGFKDVKQGYQDTRKQEVVPAKPVVKTSI